jgi:hypothetical protein
MLADAIVVAHLLIVLFIVGGLPVVYIGVALRWRWVRYWPWRVAHGGEGRNDPSSARGAAPHAYRACGMTAVASISTLACASISATTCTTLMAGKCLPITARYAAPIRFSSA